MKFSFEESYIGENKEATEEQISAEVRAALRESVVNIIEKGDYFLGAGATAEVHFLDNNPHICYKVIRKTDVMARPDAVNSIPEKYRQVYDEKQKKTGKRMLGAPNTETPWHLPLEEEMVIQNKAAETEGGVKVPQCFGKIVVDGVEEGDGYEVRDNVTCLVMERVYGSSVSDLISKKLLPPKGFKLDDFEKKMSDFLVRMHEKGIYHRDLHDGNVMIENETGTPYMIDFGRSTVLNFSNEEPYEHEAIEGEKLRFPKDEVMFKNRVVDQLGAYLDYRKVDQS